MSSGESHREGAQQGLPTRTDARRTSLKVNDIGGKRKLKPAEMKLLKEINTNWIVT